jgi:hypothetical protein
MKIIWITLVLCFPLACAGQALLSVDKTEIRIGDQIKATITTNLSGGREWINPDACWPDSLTGIEVVNGPEWNRDRADATTATWTVAFFDTGVVRIPALKLVIQQQGQSDTFLTNDVPVKVSPVEPDSTGLSDIKDIYEHPFNPGYYKKYIPHALGAILLITALILWLRQRESKRVIPEPAPVPLLPHEWALRALDELAEKKLWQQGEVKEHYTYLTTILREYLERRFAIHAMEQTSEEILIQLRRLHLSAGLLMDTQELLSVADLIKFAKADPGKDMHAATIERVRDFVRETTPDMTQQQPDEHKPSEDEVVE